MACRWCDFAYKAKWWGFSPLVYVLSHPKQNFTDFHGWKFSSSAFVYFCIALTHTQHTHKYLSIKLMGRWLWRRVQTNNNNISSGKTGAKIVYSENLWNSGAMERVEYAGIRFDKCNKSFNKSKNIGRQQLTGPHLTKRICMELIKAYVPKPSQAKPRYAKSNHAIFLSL